jgi:tetratricopeptide (TPR) repeat protein
MSNYVYGTGSYRDYLKEKSFMDGNRVSMDISKQTLWLIGSQAVLTMANINSREQTADKMMAHQTRMTNQITNQLAKGFETISYDLHRISSGISELNSTFHWGFSNLIASMGAMNDSIQELIRIAKTPAQTAALEHFEIAREMFRQGIYTDVLEELEKAINGVPGVSAGYKQEWRVHQLKGVVKLGFADCDLSIVDLAEAEDSFIKSAQYAKTDYPKEAANAYLSAGWAAYCQGKMPEAVQHTETAVVLNPELGEALFQKAKILISQNDIEDALPELKKAIDLDVFFSLKAAGDGDFQTHDDELREFFVALTEEKYKQIENDIKHFIESKDKENLPSDLDKLIADVIFERTLLDYENARERCSTLLDDLKFHIASRIESNYFISNAIIILPDLHVTIDKFNEISSSKMDFNFIGKQLNELRLLYDNNTISSINQCMSLKNMLTKHIVELLIKAKRMTEYSINKINNNTKSNIQEKDDLASELNDGGGCGIYIFAIMLLVIGLFACKLGVEESTPLYYIWGSPFLIISAIIIVNRLKKRVIINKEIETNTIEESQLGRDMEDTKKLLKQINNLDIQIEKIIPKSEDKILAGISDEKNSI